MGLAMPGRKTHCAGQFRGKGYRAGAFNGKDFLCNSAAARDVPAHMAFGLAEKGESYAGRVALESHLFGFPQVEVGNVKIQAWPQMDPLS